MKKNTLLIGIGLIVIVIGILFFVQKQGVALPLQGELMEGEVLTEDVSSSLYKEDKDCNKVSATVTVPTFKGYTDIDPIIQGEELKKKLLKAAYRRGCPLRATRKNAKEALKRECVAKMEILKGPSVHCPIKEQNYDVDNEDYKPCRVYNRTQLRGGKTRYFYKCTALECKCNGCCTDSNSLNSDEEDFPLDDEVLDDAMLDGEVLDDAMLDGEEYEVYILEF